MSWAVEEWKEGLSTRVLHKIQELESQLEKLKRERQQRQFQLESLEAALQKQKQKVEDEKNEGATLKRENQSLIELCDNLEKTKQKLSHELQVKESQVSFQEGQLISSKKQIERLEQELKRYKSELERSQQTLIAGDSSFSSTPQKSFTIPTTPSHNDSKFDELQTKYKKEVEEKKKLEAELKTVKSHKTNPLLPQSTMSHREIARQQALSSVFSWQQEQTPSCPPSNRQETRISSGSHFPWELGSTGHQDLKSSKKVIASSILDNGKSSALTDEMKIQNQELRSRVQELEHNLQIQTSDMKLHVTKLQETQLQVENLKRELSEKSQALNKSNNEITRITAELDQTTAQLVATEEKMKRLLEQLNCQRQNSESLRHSLEQKVKEKEKEYQEELSCQLDQVRTKLQEELHQAKNNYSLLQADLEKIRLEKQRLEKNANDFTLKLNAADQAMETMQLKEKELRRNYEEVKKQNSLLSCQSSKQSQEICQLKGDLCTAKQLLQQSQSLAEEMKSKNWSLERELNILKEKAIKQDEPLEKMQLTISDLENQRESLQQLLKHKENTIEKLSIKLEDLESLQNVLAECEGLKKEVEILSQRKTESEKLLDQFHSEKEGLMSKMHSLENALMMEQIKRNDRVTVVEAENERLSMEIKNLKCVLEGKSTELEAERIAYAELQQKTVTFEEKYQKERENNSLKVSEFTEKVNILQQMLQSSADEALEKEKCISSLETSLASYVQLNTCFQKQFEELLQVRDEMERKLAEAEQKHDGFVRESEEHLSKLQVDLSETEGLVTITSAALEEKEEQLQLLIEESKRQETEIQNLKTSNELLEDSIQQLKLVPQTGSYQKQDVSPAISLNNTEIEGLKDKNTLLQSAIDTSQQNYGDLMEANLCLSNNLKDQDENLSELSERCRENSTLSLQVKERLEKKCTSLEAKNHYLECSVRAQTCPFEAEKAEFKYQEKQLTNEHEELQCQVLSLEQKNNILLRQLEKMQVVLEAEIVQKILSVGLEPKRSEQDTMQQHYEVLLQENKQLIEEMRIRNKHATSGFALNKASLEQLMVSVKEKEEELDKYQVKLELLQMDLEDKEVSIKNYADQVKQLETALRTMGMKIEESEREKERLKQEIQTLKELENLTLGFAKGDENGQSPAVFNAVTKDNFNQQIDAKCSSVPHDLMPSQNDYVQLVSSLHMTMSKLNELEKMCEHLQIEKSTLASQLKDSQLECAIGTDTMAEELRNKINVVKEKKAAFSDKWDPSEIEKQFDFEKMVFTDLKCCAGLSYEDLKLTNKEIKAHFDGIKEKILSLENQYKCLHEQNVSVGSKLSVVHCSIEMVKKENPALSTSLNQADTISFITQMTPNYRDKEHLLDGTLCLWSSHCSSTASLTESDFDSDQYRPPNEIARQDSNNKESELENTSAHQYSITELCHEDTLVRTIKQGCVIPKNYSLKNKMKQLILCETYDKSIRRLEESFEAQKNLEDEAIERIHQLLLLARKEVDCLQQKNVSDSELWQQKLHNVVLDVAPKQPAERNDTELLSQVLEEPRLHTQDLNSGSQPLFYVGTEHQLEAEQTINPLCQLETCDLSSESVTFEALHGKGKGRKYEANGTEGKRPDCETIIGVKSREACLEASGTESIRVSDKSTNPSRSPVTILPNCNNTNRIPTDILENHVTTERSPLQINVTCTLKSKLPHDMDDNLVMEVQSVNSGMRSQDKEVAVNKAACEELEKTVKELEKEKKDLSETLKSVTFDNQQLSYNLLSLEVELNKVKSDLEMYKVWLSDTREALEDLEMTKSDWTEKLLEAENGMRRIKAERENVESYALSMETDIKELQSEKEQLEKENENKLKTIFGLQEQLHIITVERNQFSQDLSALSKDKEELNHVRQKLQERIKDLESSQTDSTEFIRILESEAKAQTKLLQTAKDHIAQLSTEKDCLMLQLHNLEKVADDLVLGREMAQSQLECLSEEKEAVLREYETLQTQLNDSEKEISKISKSLEGSLVEKGELAARLNSAQEEVDQLRHGIEKLKIKIESDEKKRCRLAEKLKENARRADCLVDKIENLERELQLSEENLEDAILQAEAAKEEKEIANTELEKMHANLGNLEAEMNSLKSEKEQLERKLKEEREKATLLECGKATFVKQLEEKVIDIKSEYENALILVQSQLKQAREEIKASYSKQETCKSKEQDLMNEVTSLKHENTQLAYHLQQTKCKYSETEELMGALIQELRDIKVQLDENDSFLEQQPKTEVLQAPLEDLQAFSENPEEELGATVSQKGASIEKEGYHRLLEQLKNGENAFHPQFQHWMRSFRVLKQEREQMVKQIHELAIQLKRADPNSQTDAASKEVMLELEGLRESIEEKTREADQNLEKYCTLIIDHHKLEEENEMLKTQISFLNIQLMQSSSSTAVSCLWQSPGSPPKTGGRLLMEKTISKNVAKVQRHLENRGGGNETRSPFQETLLRNIKKRASFLQHSTTWAQDTSECESDGFPEINEGFVDITPRNSSPHSSHRTDLRPRTSPYLLNPKLGLQPSVDTINIFEMDYFPENPKATAEGSKLLKINDAQLQEITSTGSPLGFIPRSPLSTCNQSIQPIADRSAGSVDAFKARLSKSAVENELNEGCHVQ
ncbi:centromere protein F [Eublepharis macularius]|uniref:Centromere protein F n=1 Tax=Eublepharis macularius TaxID=481883 RepID=A0AA97KBD7_EUBMA|nr:centromere protein F [Eublepharis macularius]